MGQTTVHQTIDVTVVIAGGAGTTIFNKNDLLLSRENSIAIFGTAVNLTIEGPNNSKYSGTIYDKDGYPIVQIPDATETTIFSSSFPFMENLVLAMNGTDGTYFIRIWVKIQ